MSTMFLRPKLSISFLIVLGILHALSIWAVLLSGLFLSVKFVAILFVILSFAYQVYRQCFPKILSFKLSQTSSRIQINKTDWEEVEIQGSSFIMPWLVILNVKRENKRCSLSLILPADSLPRDTHRKMRSLLYSHK
jgi:toxin CptA